MARSSRQDHAGAWHHVINRGLARRPLFEDRVDIRYFLSRVAREVRRGRLEVHSWCILTTHFHMLVRSPVGQLSEAMRRIQNEYSRFFNRRHRRDGTLIRGRFMSRLVDSLTYRSVLVRYIDRNAVQAKLAATPWDYPFGSAAQYVHRRGPKWLERSWVESEVRANDSSSDFSRSGYVATFGQSNFGGLARMVDLRIQDKNHGPDDLDDLIGSAPDRVQQWMKRKAKLADGVPVGLAVCDSPSIMIAVDQAKAIVGPWSVAPNRRERDGWELILVGLMRSLAMLPWKEVGRLTGGSESSALRRFQVHEALMEGDAAYEQRVGKLAADALGVCHGSRVDGGCGESG
jgi:REP element-mobilizing transposase RayT